MKLDLEQCQSEMPTFKLNWNFVFFCWLKEGLDWIACFQLLTSAAFFACLLLKFAPFGNQSQATRDAFCNSYIKFASMKVATEKLWSEKYRLILSRNQIKATTKLLKLFESIWKKRAKQKRPQMPWVLSFVHAKMLLHISAFKCSVMCGESWPVF